MLIGISYPISHYITTNFNTENKQNWVLKISDYNLDYAITGSSRVAYVIDVKSLDSTYNKKGINIGTSGSCFAEEYLVLSEFISKNKISTLVLNTDELSFDSKKGYKYPFHDYEFLHLFDNYNDVFFDYIPKWKYYLWKIIPITKYIEFNQRFTIRNQSLQDNNMGSNLVNDTKQYKLLFLKGRQSQIKEMDAKYFFKIIDLCGRNKIKVILITTPIYCTKEETNKSNFKHYIDSVSEKLKVKYYDFDRLIEVKRSLFNDSTHTSSEGSIIYSRNLGRQLKIDGE